MLFRSIVTLIAAAALAACTTIDPYTGEQRASRAATFGGAGAVICGLIGATEDSQRARNAALGCGALGAGIGAYMDAQEAELREQLEGTGVRVRRDGDELELIMPGNITFPVDGYQIRSDFEPVLDSVAEVLYKFTDTRLQVTGHTDSTGARDYNYGLSERRARSRTSPLPATKPPPAGPRTAGWSCASSPRRSASRPCLALCRAGAPEERCRPAGKVGPWMRPITQSPADREYHPLTSCVQVSGSFRRTHASSIGRGLGPRCSVRK